MVRLDIATSVLVAGTLANAKIFGSEPNAGESTQDG